MAEFAPFHVNAANIDILVTPSEETPLTDLKKGEIDPVIKWNFTWEYDKKTFVTR